MTATVYLRVAFPADAVMYCLRKFIHISRIFINLPSEKNNFSCTPLPTKTVANSLQYFRSIHKVGNYENKGKKLIWKLTEFYENTWAIFTCRSQTQQ